MDFKIFVQENHVFLYAATCLLSQFDGKKKSYENLKQRATREMISLLNHLVNILIFIRFKKFYSML